MSNAIGIMGDASTCKDEDKPCKGDVPCDIGPTGISPILLDAVARSLASNRGYETVSAIEESDARAAIDAMNSHLGYTPEQVREALEVIEEMLETMKIYANLDLFEGSNYPKGYTEACKALTRAERFMKGEK